MTAPTHIVANSGDRRSMCGIRDPLPVCALKHVDRIVRANGMAVCPECTARREAD